MPASVGTKHRISRCYWSSECLTARLKMMQIRARQIEDKGCCWVRKEGGTGGRLRKRASGRRAPGQGVASVPGDRRVETCLSRRLVELEHSEDRKPSSIGNLVPPGREVGSRCRAWSTRVPQSHLGLNSITKLMF